MVGPGPFFVLALALYVPNPAELGIQLTGVHLHKIDEAPVGVGVRFFLNLTENAALDSEFTRYSEKSSALVGVKTGWRGDRFGLFAKARAGLWHFGGSFFEARLNRQTIPAGDLGGVIEYYPTPRTAVRIDLGDTVLFYGAQSLRGVTGRLGTVHNFQPGLGFSWRF